MPNHTANILTLSLHKNTKDTFVRTHFYISQLDVLTDVKYIMKMMNVKSDDTFHLIDKFINDIKAKPGARVIDNEKLMDFASLYPCPKSEDWYHWCTEHWGTKWGAYDIDDWQFENNYFNHTATIYYNTAWGPPIRFYLHVSKMYKHLVFKQEYADEGGGFLGCTVIYDGRKQFECQYDWSSEKGIEVRKRLGRYYSDEENDEVYEENDEGEGEGEEEDGEEEEGEKSEEEEGEKSEEEEGEKSEEGEKRGEKEDEE